MSNSNRFLVAAVLCSSIAGGLFLMGTSGPGIPVAVAAFTVGALALVASLVLRRREAQPSPTQTRPSLPVGSTRVGAIGVAVGAVLGVFALTLTFTVAEGEARGHGVFHLLFGAILLGLFAAVDRHPLGGTTGASLRGSVLVVSWIALAGAFLESIGAAGYDEFNAGHEIVWLTTVHNAVTPLGALALLAIPMALAALTGAFVGRLRARRAATS